MNHFAANFTLETVGILALQGAFGKHAAIVKALGYRSKLVRLPEDLVGISGLIIPGGESTAIGRLMSRNGLTTVIRKAVVSGMAVFGTCAGLILLASDIEGSAIPGGLGLMDCSVTRNGYGAQLDSFNTEVKDEKNVFGGNSQLEAIFIRAPRIVRTGPEVEVLCSLSGEPVLIRQGWILGCAFHPELTNDFRIHQYFLDMVC